MTLPVPMTSVFNESSMCDKYDNSTSITISLADGVSPAMPVSNMNFLSYSNFELAPYKMKETLNDGKVDNDAS